MTVRNPEFQPRDRWWHSPICRLSLWLLYPGSRRLGRRLGCACVTLALFLWAIGWRLCGGGRPFCD